MRTLILFIGITFFLFSCEEVIEIDIKNADHQIVIEAIMTDSSSHYTVKITKSGDFYKPGIYEEITQAIVTLSDEDGNSELLKEIKNGIYEANEIIGFPEKIYYLNIIIEGKEYTARSKMPKKVILEKLTYHYEEMTNPHQTSIAFIK